VGQIAFFDGLEFFKQRDYDEGMASEHTNSAIHRAQHCQMTAEVAQ
jgi:hypothetical protein